MTAVLIDSVSIQPYIFSSNKLKENIGASFIIEKLLFNEVMIATLKDKFNDHFANDWKKNPGDIKIEKEEIQCEIGYIGGGNALVLFKEESHAQWFIREYSTEVLLRFPGIRLAFGVDAQFDVTEEGFQDSRMRLNEALIKNKSHEFRNVVPFKNGIVEDCPLSNEAQELEHPIEKNRFISALSHVKFEACKVSQESIHATYKEELNDRYSLTDELDKLGQPADKGYIAVVHVDGNGIGQRFMACKDLADLRKLSVEVSKLAENAMKQLIAYTVKLFDGKELNKENGFDLRNDGQKRILPIRPIIVGGDDITFVCEGRLGVHLAEKLIEFMTSTKISNETIAACAGIAIVHTKYPFYRAYTLAEELTAKAKNASRKEKSSWLSFLISSGGFSGSLEEIISQKFETPNGNLYGGPYRIDQPNNTMKALKDGLRFLTIENESKWPQSKLMEMRNVLRKNAASIQYFITETKARGRGLPKDFGASLSENLWDDQATPYYDIIELKDFYPGELL
jgi:hypothetical protein